MQQPVLVDSTSDSDDVELEILLTPLAVSSPPDLPVMESNKLSAYPEDEIAVEEIGGAGPAEVDSNGSVTFNPEDEAAVVELDGVVPDELIAPPDIGEVAEDHLETEPDDAEIPVAIGEGDNRVPVADAADPEEEVEVPDPDTDEVDAVEAVPVPYADNLVPVADDAEAEDGEVPDPFAVGGDVVEAVPVPEAAEEDINQVPNDEVPADELDMVDAELADPDNSIEEEESDDGDIEVWDDELSDTENITFMEDQSEDDSIDEETQENTVLAEQDAGETSDATSEFVTPVDSPTQIDVDSFDEDSLDEDDAEIVRPQFENRSRYGRLRKETDKFGFGKKSEGSKINRYSSTVLMNINSDSMNNNNK